MYDIDYLIIGAGAMGMAFADVILTETDATVAIVDRRPRPGGHWNDAYPHVRLHQPSAFYGVNSRELGTGTKDVHGWNKGLQELASGTEVVAYFDQVLRQQFLGSGRVRYFPMNEYEGDRTFRSLVSGERTTVRARKVVDATYMNVVVPSVRPPVYGVAEGVICVPPNELGKPGVLTGQAVVVVGGGKTAMDACLFMLEHGVPATDITWIRPRDQWCLNRARIQPGLEYFDESVGGQALQLKAIAESENIDDLFDRLQSNGLLLRFDPDISPSMYRCATVTETEIEALRTITNVIRLGHVKRLEADQIVLAKGSVATAPGTVHVDCTADGLEQRPVVPVFDDDTITLQTIRSCQQVFSAAFIAHVEAAYETDDEKSARATVVPHPGSGLDWLRVTLAHMTNSLVWQQDAELSAWLSTCRLNASSQIVAPSPESATAEQTAVVEMIAQNAKPAMIKLQEYVASLDTRR